MCQSLLCKYLRYAHKDAINRVVRGEFQMKEQWERLLLTLEAKKSD